MARLGTGIRRFFDGVPRWLAVWTDAHPRYPGWLPAPVFAGVAYLVVAAFGVAAGDIRKAVTDWNLGGISIYVLLGSLALVYLPRIAARVETSLKPWVTDGAEFLAPRRLTRLFWPVAIFVALGMSAWAFQDPTESALFSTYPNPAAARWLIPTLGLVWSYFLGGSIAIAAFGVTLYARGIQRHMALPPDFLLQAGKASLRPLGNLIIATWLLVTAPIIAMMTINFTITVPALGDQGSGLQALNIFLYLAVLALLLPTVFLPQIYVNRLLSSQKAREHHDLRGRLDSLAELPADRKPDDVMERLLLHHHLTGQLQQLQSISPSLMDIRFFVQISASMTAIFLANLLLRALVN